MVKSDWGLKRVCQKCRAPFYDMKRQPIVCPKCHEEYDEEQEKLEHLETGNLQQIAKKLSKKSPQEQIPTFEEQEFDLDSDFFDFMEDDFFEEDRV